MTMMIGVDAEARYYEQLERIKMNLEAVNEVVRQMEEHPPENITWGNVEAILRLANRIEKVTA